jgi:predicted RNase H-like HicB family nuclease
MSPRRHPEALERAGVLTTSHEYRGYVFTITYRPRDPAYTVDYPDFPEIITSGESLAEAFGHACEALDLHLETLAKLGYDMPKPKHRLVVEAAGT